MRGELVKVAFAVDPAETGGVTAETLWAERVGEDRVRLANTPFFARGVSLGDVVFARRDAGGRLAFAGASIAAGHSTVWIALAVPRAAPAFRRAWRRLAAHGCSSECDGGRFLAVDVPPAADLDAVLMALEAGAAEGAWDFELGHRGHLPSAREPVAPWGAAAAITGRASA